MWSSRAAGSSSSASAPKASARPSSPHKLRNFAGNEQYLREIAETPVVPDQWQLEKLALVGLNHEFFFYTPGVSPDDLGAFGMRCFSDVNAAIVACSMACRPVRGCPDSGRPLLFCPGRRLSRFCDHADFTFFGLMHSPARPALEICSFCRIPECGPSRVPWLGFRITVLQTSPLDSLLNLH